MTPSLPASARHRLRRLVAVPALVAALLTVSIAVPATAAATAAAAAAQATAAQTIAAAQATDKAPAATALASTGSAPAAPAATDDAPSMTFAVAPAAGGVVTAGQPLTVSVSARNATGSTVPPAAVRLSSSARPLTTRAEVRAWFDDSAADASRTELAVADGEIPAVVALGVAGATLSIDPAALATLAPGVYPLRADYGNDQTPVSARSVLVVPGDAGMGALGVIAPINAPPIGDGLLTASELETLTAPDGSLRAQLDAVTGTPAILAVDPAVVAAIRVLGTSAPATATQWLADLLALPNSRFALQFGDADLATQLGAGLGAPLTVASLTPYLDASDFSGITPSPTPSASADTGTDQAPAGAPTPTASTAPGGVVLPTLAQLTDIGGSPAPVFWPATGSAGADTVAALGALAVDGTPPITLVDSGALASTGTEASPAPAWATAGDARVLVYDADASRALTAAAASDVPIARAGALAEASAFAALAVAADPASPVLVALDRPAEPSAAGARTAILAGAHLAGRTATDLSSLTAGAPAAVSLAAVPADADRVEALGSLLAGEDELANFATILADPAVITARERASILQLLGNGWRAVPTQASAALAAHRAQTQKTLDAVAVVPPSDITLAATSAPLTFSVRNDLPWPVSLRLIATPNDPRLIVQNTTTVDAGPAQSTRVQVPVQARVGSGESTLALQLRSPSMVAVGDTVPVHVTVRAEWESVGLVVMSTLILAMIVIGVVRTVRKLRRRKRGTDA